MSWHGHSAPSTQTQSFRASTAFLHAPAADVRPRVDPKSPQQDPTRLLDRIPDHLLELGQPLVKRR